MTQAVIFDLDGVIVATDDLHYQAWKQIADREGIPFDRTIGHRLRGISRMDSLHIVLQQATRPYTPAQQLQLAEDKNVIYTRLLQDLSNRDILPGVMDALQAFKQAGLKVAVGSSSRNAIKIIHKLGIAQVFDALIDGTMVRYAKPDPQIFLLAAQQMGCRSAACAVVEDADAGLRAAVAAGMLPVAVGAAYGHPCGILQYPDLAQATGPEGLVQAVLNYPV